MGGGNFPAFVNPDFTLKDGLTICAAITCVCNAELIIYALVSGALGRRWASRHSSCLGALGLLFEVGRQRNGGVHNVGSGCMTRRTQPWINTRKIDGAKCKRLIDCTVVELCTILTLIPTMVRMPHVSQFVMKRKRGGTRVGKAKNALFLLPTWYF
jgi:hypothetical protein